MTKERAGKSILFPVVVFVLTAIPWTLSHSQEKQPKGSGLVSCIKACLPAGSPGQLTTLPGTFKKAWRSPSSSKMSSRALPRPVTW